jgi:hypothetical protein
VDEAERTHVITVSCQAAFKALVTKMRFFRNRYFKIPPLTGEDWAAAEPFLAGRRELGVRIVFVSGDPNDRANEGFRLWYKLVEPGGPPVTDPAQFDESLFTRRKKDVITFACADSGKTVYIAVQIENGGKKGPWGPLVSALVP